MQAGANTASDLVDRLWDENIEPDPPLDPAEWAEAYRTLTSREAARTGAWLNARVPYAVAPMRAMGPRSLAEVVVVWCSAQAAKTEILNNCIGHAIQMWPRPIMAMHPTQNTAKRWVRQRLDVMIDVNPTLRPLVSAARTGDERSSRFFKDFPGGSAIITWAGSAAEAAGAPIGLFAADEIDKFDVDVDDQGDPLEQGATRTQGWHRPKQLYTSTPTREGTSRIVREYNACEQAHVYHVPCPFCGVHQELVFQQLKYELPAGFSFEDGRGGLREVRGVTYECTACHAAIPEAYKPRMLAAGAYVEVWNRGDKSVGFRIPGLCAAFLSWGRVAAMYERAKERPETMQTFTNLALGLPYAEVHDAPPWQPLYDRRETYHHGEVQPGCRFLTAFVDVHKDRLEFLLVGWGRDERAWSITHEQIVRGSPETKDEPWDELDRLLAQPWPCVGGGSLWIDVLGIDSGYATDRVLRWAAGHTQPVYGAGKITIERAGTVVVTKGASKDTLKKIWVSDKVTASEREHGLKTAMVGTMKLKGALYSRLKAEKRADGSEPFGYIHFPQHHDEYFKQLTSEREFRKHTKGGQPKYYWDTIVPGARNEILDLWVGNMAMAAARGIDAMREEHWANFERQIPPGLLVEHVVPPDAVVPSHIPSAPPVVPREQPASLPPPRRSVVTNPLMDRYRR